MSFISIIKGLFGLGSKPLSLSPGDRLLSCEDCNQQFVFDAGEQKFFKEKGFTDPKRCPRCRKKVRSKMRRHTRRNRSGGGHHHHFDKSKNERRHNRGNHHHNNHRQRNHNSIIDGDSPYADER